MACNKQRTVVHIKSQTLYVKSHVNNVKKTYQRIIQ